MSSNLTPIDISNMPDLVRIVEDMKHTKEPRLLKKGSAPGCYARAYGNDGDYVACLLIKESMQFNLTFTLL